jgi:protocatechuate 3,4-dioxygenase beta subunit
VFFRLTDRSPWRPAHIHLKITHDDYKPVVSQLYPKNDPHLVDDSVFAVKDDLVVEFPHLEGDPKATCELNYPIRLAPAHGQNTSIPRL